MPELYKEQVVGQRIVNIFQTKWEKSKGVEMIGLCGEDWYCCKIFIELSNGVFFELGCCGLFISASRPPNLIPAEIGPEEYVDGPNTYYKELVVGTNKIKVACEQVLQRPAPCLNETIVEVITPDDEMPECVFLLLSSGRYLENSHVPGGNKLLLCDTSDLAGDDYRTYWEQKPYRIDEK